MSDMWNKLLEDDLIVHLEDDLRIGALEVMNERPLQHEELWQGMPVYWIHTPRGGWGIPFEVKAVVWSWSDKRVTIDAERKDGTAKRASVLLSNLRHREEQVYMNIADRLHAALSARACMWDIMRQGEETMPLTNAMMRAELRATCLEVIESLQADYGYRWPLAAPELYRKYVLDPANKAGVWTVSEVVLLRRGQLAQVREGAW